VCERHGIPTSLFLLVCNVYTFDDYTPDAGAMADISLLDVMDYLHRYHKDFLDDRLPKMIDRMLKLVDSSRMEFGHSVARFCENYRKESMARIRYRERVVFPYIAALLRGERPPQRTIEEYDRIDYSHAALEDLLRIIIGYLPEGTVLDTCRDDLTELSRFKIDTNRHHVLEKKLLIAQARRLDGYHTNAANKGLKQINSNG
jgi:regulator of cell morphogenesis and NO signaling